DTNQKNVMVHRGLWLGIGITKHANGSDYWVVLRKTYSTQPDSLFAYRLGADGLDTVPVVSSLDNSIYSSSEGLVRFNTRGDKVAYGGGLHLRLARFDRQTGLFYDPV